MKALGFPKAHRLLRPADYSKVFNDVQLKVSHRNFLILATPNPFGHARIGLVFSKKHLKLAVQRNRVKRQVRETFRRQRELPAVDIVILGRQGLAELCGHHADVHRRAAPAELGAAQPGAVQRRVAELEQQPLLRVHCARLGG